MLCPVCKTECEQSSICPNCGFLEVGKLFINQEEAEQWYKTVVVPFKNTFNSANVLPPIDWVEVFKQSAQAKRLFDFSIPATNKRRINLDAIKNPIHVVHPAILQNVWPIQAPHP